MSKRSSDEWQQRDIVARWRASGLSQAEFCRQEGLEQWQLSEWKRKVAREDGVKPSSNAAFRNREAENTSHEFKSQHKLPGGPQHGVKNQRLERETVAKWRASGLSQAEFCRQQGLQEHTLSQWKRREERNNDLVARAAKEKAIADRKAKRRAAKEKYWRTLVDEHIDSGLSVIEFCKRKGISWNSLKRWRQELVDVEQQVFSSTSVRQKNPFVQVAVPELAASAKSANSEVEIILPGNSKIIVTEQTSFALLAKLLKALKEPSC